MYNIEEVHCNAAIAAVLQANRHLMHASVEDAITPDDYGKSDTLGLDGIPEIRIKDSLKNFNKDAIIITEEIGSTRATSYYQRGVCNNSFTFYVSDPTDRSSQLKRFLENKERSVETGEVIQNSHTTQEWEQQCGKPASITGATSAITCVRKGVPIASAFVNLITQELFVAFTDGVYQLKLPSYKELKPSEITSRYVKNKGSPVYFRVFEEGRSISDMKYFVTFLGKAGYEENFRDSNIINETQSQKYLLYDRPGGPSRVLYLSTLQPEKVPVGFILANGEKIIEWIHWLPFVRFGKMENDKNRSALHLYEIYQKRPWTKEGILMSTPPPYSIFVPVEEKSDTMIIDVNRFSNFSNPSKIRSTLLLAPISNSWAITVMQRHLYREIELADTE